MNLDGTLIARSLIILEQWKSGTAFGEIMFFHVSITITCLSMASEEKSRNKSDLRQILISLLSKLYCEVEVRAVINH